jgi:signal transduction histidine kinase
LGRTIYWKPSGQVVEGRSDDVVEVLNILLNNAARHAPESPGAVTTELDGETVRILVSDWGPGVAPELRDRIFEVDVRGPHSPGEGIGLALARRLMEEQRGFVDLVETDDRGATFVVGLHSWKGADDPAIAR